MNSQDWLGLAGKICVITGAASGMGRETAKAFGDAGAKLVLLDRDGEHLITLANELESQGVEVLPAPCDVGDSNAVEAISNRSRELLGPCEVLVNCAASNPPGPLLLETTEKWQSTFRVNLGGVLNCSQQFGRQMMEGRGGSIVHFASIAGSHPFPNSGSYCTSKAAVIMLSRQLAMEWAPHGIRSNSVSPGLIRTPMTEHHYNDDEMRKRRDAAIPVGRVGDASDLADVVVFLASHRARYITGQDIIVDGGLTQTLTSVIPFAKKQ